MNDPSIPDRAAAFVERKNRVDAKIRNLKDDGGDWTRWLMLLDEATSVASDGLRKAYCLMDRIEWLIPEQQKEQDK